MYIVPTKIVIMFIELMKEATLNKPIHSLTIELMKSKHCCLHKTLW